ncbi:phosphate/phosphite/phosphonate ABC transporter substrate-binding protein [Sulfurimonas sp. SAG-AH-194-L11]|nr:phosphate/phosphite/phosphonate ABC transporter substrate-binding protein [Sulfurimonas sp. SAG-AH-194-L11]MDF1876420.1 phosphate/phosphite/phosphonate ABC transporter substrate-binding protein [Sulfurimonas sp. SAG-AH-194-L11]
MKIKDLFLLVRTLLLFALSTSFLYGESIKEINLGILSLAPPTTTYKSWKPFAKYLSKKTGLKVNIIAPKGFKKLKTMAVDKKVDIFYINSLIFYKLKIAKQAVAIAQMKNIANEITSRSDIFVRRDSKIDSVSQLKGKTVAYVSPMGAGGYLAPKAYLINEGLQPKEIFTKNLTNSIYNVLLGKVDAATMCGVNYKLMSQKLQTGELKIIASSTKYPENVLAARSGLSLAFVDKIKKIVIGMPQSKEGKTVLNKMQSMKIKEFILYDERIENLTKELLLVGE